MPALKSQLTERVIKRALNQKKNNWTPLEAAEWSGIQYRTLLRLLKEGLVPSIRVGKPHAQRVGKDKKPCQRACTRYIIPRVAFQKWFESIGAPNPSSIGDSAA